MDQVALGAFIDRFMDQEKGNTRRWLLVEMDSLLDALFGQLKTRLVESITAESGNLLSTREAVSSAQEELPSYSTAVEPAVIIDQPEVKEELFGDEAFQWELELLSAGVPPGQPGQPSTQSDSAVPIPNVPSTSQNTFEAVPTDESVFNVHDTFDLDDSDCDCSDCDLDREYTIPKTAKQEEESESNSPNDSHIDTGLNSLPIQQHSGHLAPSQRKVQKSASSVPAPSSKRLRHKRPHHDRFKQIFCPFPFCNRHFHRNFEMKVHYRSHFGIKPFRCKYPGCGYASEQRTNTVTHIRMKHFNLPQKRKSDPRELREVLAYLEVIGELLK